MSRLPVHLSAAALNPGTMPPTDSPHDDYEVCTASTDRSSWHPLVAAFYANWLGVAGRGRLPVRLKFEPQDISTMLPGMWLFDVQRDPLRFRVRVIGPRFAHVFGQDISGKWLDVAHHGSPNLERVTRRLERSVLERVATHSSGAVSLFDRNEAVWVENVTVPLARDGVTVDTLAGFSWLSSPSGARL